MVFGYGRHISRILDVICIVALLESDSDKVSYVDDEDRQNNARAQENISRVKEAIRTDKPDVLKDTAVKALYHTLYEIVEVAYSNEAFEKLNQDEKEKNEIYNAAIGVALLKAITEETPGSTPDDRIIALRKELATVVKKALTPQRQKPPVPRSLPKP
jgi:hypothetical protein